MEDKEIKDKKGDNIQTATIKVPAIVKKNDVQTATIKVPAIVKKDGVQTATIKVPTIVKKNKQDWIQNSKDVEIEELTNILTKENQKESSIFLTEKKSEEFKNIYTKVNRESQTFMTNNQVKKEQEKSVLTITKFLDEELEFLKEEHISIHDSDSKWSWLTNELAEKYFISILLPYYIIKPNLTLGELYLLGFRAFITKIRRTLRINFSVIKNKYLNLNKQKLINNLNEKFGIVRANIKIENAKCRIENITDSASRVTRLAISNNRNKIKLLLDLGFSSIKCQECDIGVDLLVALQLHHPTESKEIILKNLYSRPKEEYKLILEKFKKDKVKLLCENHHKEKRIFYPITFKDIIFKKDLFSMSAEEIDAYIDDYLLTFVKTERYREIIYEKYTSKNKGIPLIPILIAKWKYYIQRWIKKRFVFDELFDGKCLICGDSNLFHLVLHHIDQNLKNLIYKWESISKFDSDEIMRIIIKEKCISICANCHAFITSKYYLSIRDVLKGFFSLQKIDKISKEVTLKYNNAIEKISNFSYDLKNINFTCPLKLEFRNLRKSSSIQNDFWKIHLMTVYYYLEIKEINFFLKNEILYDLELTPYFIKKLIERLIDMGYVQKFDSLIKYSLTEKGTDKVLELIKSYSKKAHDIKRLIKKYLNKKGKYEFLDYIYSDDAKCQIPKNKYSDEEIKLKFCLIIFDLISKKGKNEFTTKELIPFFNYKDNLNSIGKNLTFKLLPFNLIEEIDNSTSYQHINPNYVEINETKILIGGSAKIYKLTNRGFDVVKNGFSYIS